MKLELTFLTSIGGPLRGKNVKDAIVEQIRTFISRIAILCEGIDEKEIGRKVDLRNEPETNARSCSVKSKEGDCYQKET